MSPLDTTPAADRDPVTIADTIAQSTEREQETDEPNLVLELSTMPYGLLKALESLHEKQAQVMTIYETADLTPFYSYAVVCTGLSAVQRDVLAKTVRADLHQIPLNMLSLEGTGESGWVLMDYRDFIIHVQSPEARTFYKLDRLWDDLPSCTPDEAEVLAAIAAVEE